MPAVSNSQRIAIAIAEHDPDKLYGRNKGLLNMTHAQQHDFAATPSKGLPQHIGKKYYGQGEQPDKWSQEAFSRAGEKGHSLHASLHVPEGQPIPKEKVRAASHSHNPHLQHQAQAALNMNKRYYGAA
jgi:hypothetical protein